MVFPEGYPYWLLIIPAALALSSLFAGAVFLAVLAAARSPRSAFARFAIACGALALTAVDFALSLGGIVSDSIARVVLTADLFAIVFVFAIAVSIVVNLRARALASPAALFAFGSIAALVVGAVVRVLSSVPVDLHEHDSYFVVYHTEGSRLATIFVLFAGAYRLGLWRRPSEDIVRFGRWHALVTVAASALILVNPRFFHGSDCNGVSRSTIRPTCAGRRSSPAPPSCSSRRLARRSACSRGRAKAAGGDDRPRAVRLGTLNAAVRRLQLDPSQRRTA